MTGKYRLVSNMRLRAKLTRGVDAIHADVEDNCRATIRVRLALTLIVAL